MNTIEHNSQPMIDDSRPLWRYMTFAKLVSLLERRALFFSRADCLGDPYEGAIGPASLEKSQRREWEASMREMEPTLSPETIESVCRSFHKLGLAEVVNILVSCWHHSETESSALWRVYGRAVDEVVAIKTTPPLLREVLQNDQGIQLHKVQYLGASERAESSRRFQCKRKWFEYELEVRAVKTVLQPHGTGEFVSVDIEKLITGIYVSPFASDWFSDGVKSVSAKFGKFDVKPSSMRESPFY